MLVSRSVGPEDGPITKQTVPQLEGARREARQAAPFRHRPPLDGVRAVAAMLVILFHAGIALFGHGYVGVDVFFVLSGFLITSLLARELIGTGRLDLVAFYARRARRLLPPALVVLLVTALAYQVVASPVAIMENRGGFVAASLYVANWFFLARSQDYFAEDGQPSPVQHYWSLSVEEQFYLVWPALMIVLALLVRRYRLRPATVVGILAVAGLVYAGLVAAHDPMGSYFGSLSRAYQLLAGATLALVCLRWESTVHAGRRHAQARPRSLAPPWLIGSIAPLGLAAIGVAALPWNDHGSAYSHGAVSVLGTCALILGLEVAPASLTARLLSLRPARTLGGWSYSAYLWHWPVIVIGDEAGLLADRGIRRTAVVVGVTLLLAGATAALLERPARRVRLHTVTRRRVVTGLAAGTAVVAALSCFALLPVSGQAEKVLAQATAEPDQLDRAVTTSGGKSATVLLVGDSHARFLFPAFADLARDQGWTLVPVFHSACPWPRVAATQDDGTALDCDSTRNRAVRAAERNRPDLVILVSRSAVRRPVRVDGELLRPGDPGWVDEIRRGTDRFLSELQPLAKHMVIIEPIAETRSSMLDCLAEGQDPSSCDAPAVGHEGTAPLEREWRSLPGVTTVSLDDLICPGGTCPSMVDGIVTHRDNNHLTVPYARHIAPDIDALLRENGIVLSTGTADVN
jgi:peptidoglycan/LPS O-acetylase OafA/YrhL